MKVRWLSGAEDDRAYWAGADPRVARRIEDLLAAVCREPFRGMGKPEPLKGPLAGWWSRRITREHRLVYRVEKGTVWVLQARYHY